MKKFFTNIPNRLKAVYIIWFFIHFILLLIGSLFDYNKYFYPFAKYYMGDSITEQPLYNEGITFNSNVYDYSEFLIFILTPVAVYFVIKLWNKNDDFEKAFEVFKVKKEILLREYYTDVSKTLVTYSQEYDNLNVSFELTKRIDFYKQRLTQLIDEVLIFFSTIIVTNCNSFKKSELNKLRENVLQIVDSTEKNFVRGLEAFVISVGHPELKSHLQLRFNSIKPTINDKVSKDLESKIKEHTLIVEVQSKKERKSRMTDLVYDALKYIFGIIIGYLLSFILR